jgi:hypothetical protein
MSEGDELKLQWPAAANTEREQRKESETESCEATARLGGLHQGLVVSSGCRQDPFQKTGHYPVSGAHTIRYLCLVDVGPWEEPHGRSSTLTSYCGCLVPIRISFRILVDSATLLIETFL